MFFFSKPLCPIYDPMSEAGKWCPTDMQWYSIILIQNISAGSVEQTFHDIINVAFRYNGEGNH